MEYEIIHLPKEKWKRTNDHEENAYAWGVMEQEELVAILKTAQDLCSNRLTIIQLWVSDNDQKQGIGHAFIEIAKEQARRERRRAVVIELTKSDVNEVAFYEQEGFCQIVKNTCSDTNSNKSSDWKENEEKLEYAWIPEAKKRLKFEDIEIRMETKKDWYQVELMTQHAFWNKHHLGCDEHYLVHKMREDKDYLPEISRIAVKDGAVIGCIMYSKSRVVDGTATHDIITFGPLCIEPKWQGCGVGELLLKETMKLAANLGYKGIVIFGEPDYYPRIGFKTCDNFHITTADGKNFDAFMGIELIKDGMKDVKGKFYEAEVFEHLPAEEVEEFNKQFPPLQKLRFPGQWD